MCECFRTGSQHYRVFSIANACGREPIWGFIGMIRSIILAPLQYNVCSCAFSRSHTPRGQFLLLAISDVKSSQEISGVFYATTFRSSITQLTSLFYTTSNTEFFASSVGTIFVSPMPNNCISPKAH